MATSGSFNTSSVGSFYFTFAWSRTGYSSENNEHYIYYEVVAHNTPGYYRTVYLKNLWINGTQKFYAAGSSSSAKTYYDGDIVTSGTMTIPGSNSSGDGYIVASFEAGVGSYPGSNTSGESSWDLDRIPRYATSNQSLSSRTVNTIKMNWSSDSTIDYIWYSTNNGSNWSGIDVSDGTSGSYTISGLSPNTTYQIKTRVRRKDSQLTTDSGATSVTTYQVGTISSAPNFNDEENPTITYSNPSGNSVTTLQACIASNDGQVIYASYRDITKTGTSYTFNLTDAERVKLRKACADSSDGLSLRFYIATISGGTTYRKYVGKTMTIKNGEPVFSNYTIQDTNSKVLALTGNNQKYIRKYSNAKVTISSANKMVAQKEATAKNYNIIIGEKNQLVTYSESDITVTINNMDGNTVQVYAIDSRNKQTHVDKSLDIITYKEIILNNIQFNRKNSVEETVIVTGNGTWTNVDFGDVVNSIKTFAFRKKNTKEGTWSEWFSLIDLFHINEDGTFTNKVENEITATTFDFGEEYTIEVKIEDELSTDTKTTSVSSGKILMSALKEYGVCFGGVYDKEKGGPLQVNGENIENLIIGTVLYENIKGSTGDIVLSEPARQYEYLEIFANRGNRAFSTKVKTNTLYIPLNHQRIVSDLLYAYVKELSIQDKTLHVEYSRFTYGDVVAEDDATYIYKVIGINKLESNFINFTVDGKVYYTPEGSTWRQFVDSKYNTLPFVFMDIGWGYLVATDGTTANKVVYYSNQYNYVKEETVIQNGDTYVYNTEPT